MESQTLTTDLTCDSGEGSGLVYHGGSSPTKKSLLKKKSMAIA